MKEVLPETTFFEGDSRGIILFHAYTGSPNDVRSLGRSLNNAGYSVLLPLFAGHGTKRPEDILASGPALWHENLVESVAFMREKGCSSLALFGLSLGGIFAMKGIELYPEVVIGGGPFCSPIVPDSKTNIIPSFKFLSKSLISKESDSQNDVKARLELIDTPLKKQLSQIKEYTTTVFSELATVKQPILLVQAGQDKMINPEDVYIIQAALLDAPTEIKWYEESGHVITTGTERQKFQEDVLAFVETLPWK